MGLSICIMACNDADRLKRTLTAISAAVGDQHFSGCILAPNLCEPALSIARAYASADAHFTLHETAISDIAHTINNYIHHYAPPANAHVFLDAIAEPCPLAFVHLASELFKNKDAYGATALPASGMNKRRWATNTILNGGLNRQLFALSRECIERLRAHDIYLPLGLEGVGGLLAYLLLTDLKGGADENQGYRLVVADDAHFVFDQPNFTRKDLDRLRARMRRRAKRRLQNEVLYPLLKREGVKALPVTAVELNRLVKQRRLQPRRDPVNWWFDRIALDEIAAG